MTQGEAMNETYFGTPIWKSLDFLGYSNYKINQFGDVVNIGGKNKRMRPVRRQVTDRGYVYIPLFDGKGVRTNHGLAKIVASTFLEPPSDFYDTIIYKDLDKSNCHISNLAWRSRSYARRYHSQDLEDESKSFLAPVTSILYGEGRPLYSHHPSKRSAGIHFGILAQEVNTCVVLGRESPTIPGLFFENGYLDITPTNP